MVILVNSKHLTVFNGVISLSECTKRNLILNCLCLKQCLSDLEIDFGTFEEIRNRGYCITRSTFIKKIKAKTTYVSNKINWSNGESILLDVFSGLTRALCLDVNYLDSYVTLTNSEKNVIITTKYYLCQRQRIQRVASLFTNKIFGLILDR